LTLSLSSAGLRAYARSSRQPDIAVLDLSTFNSIETEVKRLLEEKGAEEGTPTPTASP